MLIFLLFPFLTLPSGKKIRTFVLSELTYRIISNKLTANSATDSAKAMVLFQFIEKEISAPEQNHTEDGNPFLILSSGYGYCDQQANLLNILASRAGIRGRLFFLFGDDSVSHHSVSELEVKGKYRIFDPFYHQVFLTKDNTLAEFSDLQNKNIILEKVQINLPKNYFSLFDKKYPAQYFSNNEISAMRGFAGKVLASWYFIVGKKIFSIYLSAYYYVDGTCSVEKQRIKELFGSFSLSTSLTPPLKGEK